MNLEHLPILIILVLGVIGNNHSVSIAAASLLLIKLLGFNSWFPVIEDKGLTAGITILTISVLTPLASGKISIQDMATAFKNPSGILGVLAGIFVAWSAGQGLSLISTIPQVVSALVIGTIVGVCFFHGLAVGPLIAAGIVSIILAAMKHFS